MNGLLAGDTAADGVRAPVAAGLAAEVRFAFRSLRRRPGLSVAAIVILAFAVGANTTVFSVVKAILIERIPFPGPDRRVILWDASEVAPDRTIPITLDPYRAWAGRSDLFAAVGAFETTTPSLLQGEWPDRIDGALVTANLLPLLGARPALGRLLVPEDEAAGAAPVVVLSHGLWESRFGSDPSIVGRQIQLGGTATTIVGVTAAGFWFYDPYSATRSLSGWSAEAARLWQPLPASPFGG
jgi:putative ABC transport system permease protein